MKITIVPILILCLFLYSCKEDEPTSPEETSTGDNQTEVEIGPDGGTLVTEDIELIIPSGAFTEVTELKLIYEAGSDEFSDNRVTPIFRIEGIPQSFKKHLRLALKYEGTLSNESYISIGEEVFVKSLGKLTTTYYPIEATDSSGYLVCNLSVSESNNSALRIIDKISDIHEWIKVVGVTNLHNTISQNSHFKVIGPENNTTLLQLNDVASKCEFAYQIFSTINMNYDKIKHWPIPIFVKTIIEDDPKYFTNGFFTASTYYKDNGFIVINVLILNDDERLSRIIGHEFLHLTQWLYDPRTLNKKMNEYGRQYWLDEATAVFSEEYFVNDPSNYVSGSFEIKPLAPLDGFHKDGEPAGIHGYGMASVIKYLSRHFQSSTIVNYYQDISKNLHPVETVIKNSDGSTDWVAPFFRSYIEGNIYNISVSDWVENIKATDKFEVNTSNDTLKYYSYSYKDLSARLFNVLLNYQGIQENTNISFNFPGNEDLMTEISVYKFDGDNKLEFIENDVTEVTVPEIKALQTSGWNLLALVTNANAQSPYTGNYSIDFKILLDTLKSLDYSSIYLEMKGDRTRQISHYWGYDEVLIDTAVFGTSVLGENKFTEIIMGDSTLEARWDIDEVYGVFLPKLEATLYVEFNSNRTKINRLELRSLRTEKDGSSPSEYEIIIADIPIRSKDWYRLGPEDDPCSHLLLFNDEGRTEFSDGTTISTMIGWECIEDSYIDIFFYR